MTRIISGTAGGPAARDAVGADHASDDRPRARGAVLQHRSWCGSLHGLRFLDLYAGSGAVGLEASVTRRGGGHPGRAPTVAPRGWSADERPGAALRQGPRGDRLGRRDAARATERAVRRGLPRPAVPVDEAGLGRRPVRAGRARLAGPRRAMVVSSAPAQPRADLAGRGSTDDPRRATARPCFGTVRAAHGEAAEPPTAHAPCRLPGILRPGDQRSSRHRPVAPRPSSTRSSSRYASTRRRHGLFTLEERLEMLEQAVADRTQRHRRGVHRADRRLLPRDDVEAIVKGCGPCTDFDYELQMAQMNAQPDRRRDGVRARPARCARSSSSLVKEVASFGGDVSGAGARLRAGPLTERLAAPAR